MAFYRLHSLLKTFTLSGAIRFMFMKLRGKDTYVSGSCNNCGQCCQLINLKYRKGWIRNSRQFIELLRTHPEYNRFQIISQDSRGYLQFTCSLLSEKMGCKDYRHRLDLCRRYPDKSLILQGGSLLPGCGYVIEEVTPFSRHLEKELRKKRK